MTPYRGKNVTKQGNRKFIPVTSSNEQMCIVLWAYKIVLRRLSTKLSSYWNVPNLCENPKWRPPPY